MRALSVSIARTGNLRGSEAVMVSYKGKSKTLQTKHLKQDSSCKLKNICMYVRMYVLLQQPISKYQGPGTVSKDNLRKKKKVVLLVWKEMVVEVQFIHLAHQQQPSALCYRYHSNSGYLEHPRGRN